MMTRNRSKSNFDQVIEVKPVAETEMANVFTFFNQSSRDTIEIRQKQGALALEEQFTFQANNSMPSANLSHSHSDVYQTQSSRDSR